MRRGFSTTAALLAALLTAGTASAQTPAPADQEKAAAIQELLEMTQVAGQVEQLRQALLPSITELVTSVNPGLDSRVRTIIDEELTQGLEDAVSAGASAGIAIWAEYFEVGEVRELIAFYKTPLGQKLIRVQPEIMQRSFQQGGELGRQAMQQALDRLKQRLVDEKLNVPSQL